ncbi:MAG: PilZ domain-containing protein [Candidatus Omnitrophota bacterium]
MRTPGVNERRQFKRIKRNLFVQCRYYDSANVWSSVIVQDISMAGMSFLAGKSFRIGAILEIKISTFIRRETLAIIGKVIDCKEKATKRSWITRVSITQISQNDKPVFQEFMQVFLKAAKNIS